MPSQTSRLTHWSILLGVLLLSFFVLVHNLDETSLWADEGWTIAATAETNPINVITKWVDEDVHPPLFFINLNIWRQFTGDTIFEMRYFSVLITLIGIAVMYRLGKAMFSARTGVIAALFFGLHDLVTVLTQEVRHYPQQQTATALALWMYWRFWQRPTRNRGVAFAISGAILIWSHYWGGLVLLALALHALVTRRQNLQPYILANVSIGLLYLPWLPSIYGQVTTERPGGLPHALANSWTVYKTLAYQLVGIPEILWLVLAGIGILGTLHATQHRDWLPTPASSLPVLVIVVVIGLSLLMNAQYPTLSFRSLAVIIPPLAVLVARTLSQFRLREQAVMLAFLLIHSLATTSAGPVERPPWPGLADFLASHTTSDELILMEMDSDEYALAYYLDHSGGDLRYLSSQHEREKNPDEFPAFLTESLVDVDGLWLARFGYFEPEHDIRPLLETMGFVQTAAPLMEWGIYVDGRPIEVFRYDRVPDEPLVVFGNVMGLMHYSYTLHDDWVTVNLLWSPTVKPEQTYTISTFMLQPGIPLERQHDSYPFEERSPTLEWEADGYYADSHRLPLPSVPGHYLVGIKVYWFLDANFTQLEIAPASDCSASETCEFIFIGEVEIN